MKIKLGSKVKDKVSGFTGIAVSKFIHLNQCVQYNVIPKVGKDNEVKKGQWFDEEQLEVVGKGITTESKPSGGGFRDYPR